MLPSFVPNFMFETSIYLTKVVYSHIYVILTLQIIIINTLLCSQTDVFFIILYVYFYFDLDECLVLLLKQKFLVSVKLFQVRLKLQLQEVRVVWGFLKF